jgi:hypothetical protein
MPNVRPWQRCMQKGSSLLQMGPERS